MGPSREGRNKFVFPLFLTFLSVHCFFPGFAYALNASDVPEGALPEVIAAKARKETDKKLAQKLPAEVEVEAPKAVEEKEAEIKALIGKIRLKSHETVSQAKFETLVDIPGLKPFMEPYENRKITFRELNELNRIIEGKLRGQGFFAVVRIPPQEIEPGGDVILEVLLARMGDLTVEGGRYYRAAMARRYWKIGRGEVLEYDKIRQAVMTMNENPDRTVKQFLKAGKEMGTTDVILKIEDKFPVHVSYIFDNQGVKLTGKERHTFTVQHNNLLTLDDIFVIGTTFGNSYGALYLQHIIPLNANGTNLIWGFSHAQVNPKKEFKSFGINASSQVYSMKLQQRLYRSSTMLANAYAGFDFKEKHTRVLSVTNAWDRLRVLSLGANMQRGDSLGIWGLSQDFFFGFSPHGNGFALTSRQGESKFFKYMFSVLRQQRLPFGTQGILRLEGQLSPDKLTPQEQFFMGGATTIRGYPESDFGADQAIFASFEYKVPLPVPRDWKLPYNKRFLRDQISFVSFADVCQHFSALQLKSSKIANRCRIGKFEVVTVQRKGIVRADG